MPNLQGDYPLLTGDVAGVGGVIKQQPEDFFVEEIPAYEASGEGEHLFLWIEKRDTSAEQLQRHLSRALGISTRDVGTAGLKDRRAVTRQYVSVPAACLERIGDIDTTDIRVLRFARHGNKLKTGHARGNRFSIRIRGVNEGADNSAAAVCRRLQECGVPNYFGEQRFGIDNETLQLGFALLKGEKKPRDVPASRRRFLVRLALSAAQSHLFNLVLAERLLGGRLSRVLLGDVMQVTASGGLFVVEDEVREQQRCDAGETVVTGPMFGPKMRAPSGEPAENERRILAECGLADGDFLRHRKLTPGTRRPSVARPEGLAYRVEGGELVLEFTLPRGAYATSLLREFQADNLVRC